MKSKTNFQKWSLIIPIIFIFIIGCKKDKNEVTPDDPSTPSQPATPPELWENVHIIDTTTFTLNQSPTLIGNGIYQFSYTGATPTITIGDIIVGSEGAGYLRKVTAVTLNSGNISLQTSQARMEDVFKKGDMNFNLDMDNMHQRTNSTGFTYPISNKTIYQNGPLSIIINSGQIDLNPNWFFDFGFNSSGITKFEMSAQNGTLNGNFNMSVTASQAITLFNKNDTLTHLTKSYTKWVPAVLLTVPVLVPIEVVLDVDLIVNYSATIGAAITKSGTYTSNNTFNLGVKYSNSQWTGISNFNPTSTFSLNPQSSGNANMTVNLGLTPHVSVKLYGVAGPYASVGLQEELTGNIASPQLDWDFKTDVWVKATAGASIDVLGYTLANYSNSWETTKLSYITPYQISIVSGNNQNGQFGQQLFNPLKVRVTDSKGSSQSNVPVYFSVANGGGSITTTTVLSDANGFAETNWTLGSNGSQEVQVSVKKAAQSNILNSPISFYAVVPSSSNNVVISNPVINYDFDGTFHTWYLNFDFVDNGCSLQNNVFWNSSNVVKLFLYQKTITINSQCTQTANEYNVVYQNNVSQTGLCSGQIAPDYVSGQWVPGKGIQIFGTNTFCYLQQDLYLQFALLSPNGDTTNVLSVQQ